MSDVCAAFSTIFVVQIAAKHTVSCFLLPLHTDFHEDTMLYTPPTLVPLPAAQTIQGLKCCGCCKDGNTNCSSCGAYEIDE